MSLHSSRGWLREQLLEGKIFDTLETLADILGAAKPKQASTERKRQPSLAAGPQPQPIASVIETEGHTVKE